uniref:Protein prenyltransferase alpha subunit repeat containing 1 n=1 Tax=Xiphophorus couchianus TaxID=32473 RepID=A0A3B5M890_9TELE
VPFQIVQNRGICPFFFLIHVLIVGTALRQTLCVFLCPTALVDITCTLLLLNPDFTTAWNVRKELLECGALNPERDLYLSKLALTKFPKSPETWIHRRWVLQHILRQFSAVAHKTQQRVEAEQPDAERSQFLGSHLDRLIHQEMKVCSDAACRYPSNYNAWSHRIWVLQHMAKGNIKVFRDELSSVHPWVSMHVSDHSGFHYRQFLLKELLNTELSQSFTCPQANGELSLADAACGDRITTVFKLFYQETELCADLIQSFPGHETLWNCFYFYLTHCLRTIMNTQICPFLVLPFSPISLPFFLVEVGCYLQKTPQPPSHGDNFNNLANSTLHLEF